MLSQTLLPAITTAPTLEALLSARCIVWTASGAGRLTDAEALALEDAAETRRRALTAPETLAQGQEAAGQAVRPARAPVPLPGRFARPTVPFRSCFSTGKRPPRSPDLEASRARAGERLRSNPLPATIEGRTIGGLTFMTQAVAAVLADEIADRGACALTYGEIATRAGACVSTAKRAVAFLREWGVLDVVVRPRPMAPNLPNLIRATSEDWKDWLTTRRTMRRAEREKAAQAKAVRERIEREARRAKRLAATADASPDASSDASPRNGGDGGENPGKGRGSKWSAPSKQSFTGKAIETVRDAIGPPRPPPGRLRPA